ncbi:protein LTO1 homolog isoform X1 [Choloepus didactylus]|uniref:protein LTO1 homolog isoform X1 n=1 Tax=Choloepus didactylus TaxID=27675 RepID=UPI00189E347F|nr:protein LTO1 homolog isoform X1 [Choloepus didactylus]
MAGSQDMFDAIVMADERFHGEGYQEGYEEGSSLGITEGRQYGTLHGAKIGSEIGCYQGFASAWKCLLCTCATEKDSKKMKVLESLIGMIQKFPYGDPTYDKLHEDLDKIRGKFKQPFHVHLLFSAGNVLVTHLGAGSKCPRGCTSPDPAAHPRPLQTAGPGQGSWQCPMDLPPPLAFNTHVPRAVHSSLTSSLWTDRPARSPLGSDTDAAAGMVLR